MSEEWKDQPVDKDRHEKLALFLDEHSDRNACIFTQKTPDPDALGAAMGMKWLLEAEFGILSDIYHAGEVSHPQNQTAVNVLDIDLKTKEDYIESEDNCEINIVVDSVPQNTGFDGLVDHFNVIIDHHQFDIESDFVDIRAVGSCSTQVWDYLNYFGPDFDTERGSRVATALLFGIRNDTGELLNEDTTPLDNQAHADLVEKMDRNEMRSIYNFSQPSHMLDLKKTAIENKRTHDSVMMSGLGIISDQKRDALPIIADEFLHTEGVETVIIFALVEDCVEASVRSNNSSVSVHDLCQSLFGEDYAGGKSKAGGARVPLGFLYSQEDPEDLRDDIWETSQEILFERIKDFVG